MEKSPQEIIEQNGSIDEILINVIEKLVNSNLTEADKILSIGF